MEYITLSNGVKMPQLGYGVYQVTQDECERCVLGALKIGYRAIDTAQSYFNSSPGISTAMCENQLSFFAPCQCLRFAGIITTLPSCRLTASFPSS